MYREYFAEHTFSGALPGRDALSVVKDCVVGTETAADALAGTGKVQLEVLAGSRAQCSTRGIHLTSGTLSCELE